jgi:RNA polymerase sigma factor (TIGR02999 family)
MMTVSPPSPPPATAHANAAAPNTDALFVEVYERLKAMASRQLSREGGATLNTTALVHELYERMARQQWGVADQPIHFFAYAARAMRNIITDRARHRLAQKSGGDWLRVTLSKHGDEAETDNLAVDVMVLDDALTRLAHEDDRAAKVVELRYFAGLSVEQIADAMQLNRRTIARDWDFARAFLRASLEP